MNLEDKIEEAVERGLYDTEVSGTTVESDTATLVLQVVETALNEAVLSGRRQGRDEAKESYLRKLEELHRPVVYATSTVCDHCLRETVYGDWAQVEWPCPTMKIVKDDNE